MRKIALFSVIVIASSFLMTSCITFVRQSLQNKIIRDTRIVEWTFETTVPAEQSSKVLFWFDIKTYNGIDIANVFKTNRMHFIRSLTNIPAGVAEFTFDTSFSYVGSNTTTTYTVTDCSFKYNFESGKEYFITVGKELKSKGNLIKFAEYSHYIYIHEYFPKLSKEGRINKKEYKDLDKNFSSYRIASIHLFDTDIVAEDYKNRQQEQMRQRREQRNR